MAEDESSLKVLCFRVFFCFCLAHLSSASCENNPVGIADGFIYINASSEHNASTPANNGRLNYTAGSSWCASTIDSNPYLQIDLQTLHIICAVSTQGNSQGDQWVKTYTLQSSTDGTTWTDYKEGGQINKKSFIGNYDKNSAVKNILYNGVAARYLRFIVDSNHNGACLRVEIFGVPRSKGNIAYFKPTNQSSTLGTSISSNAVDGGRNTHYTQCAHTVGTTYPWWRVDLGREEPVAEVRILNRGDCCAFRLNGAEIRVGNSTANGGATNHLCAGNIRVPKGQEEAFFCIPRAYGRYVSIRIPGITFDLVLCEVEVYSTRENSNSVKGCSSNPVRISDSSIIRNQRFSASSTGGGINPYDGRLRGSNCWVPNSNNDANDFLQIDLGSVYFVCGVATQGNPNANNWTTTYKIGTSLNNVNWTIYVEDDVEKTFTGNSDQNSIVRSDLYQPVAAKFIRFYPVTFKSSKALRVEVYGSLQGCLSALGNEKDLKFLGATASSQLDNTHTPGYSRLYGVTSWCSASVSLPQYLQFNAGKVITVSGIATQGDNVENKWVTSYAISYGYDGQKWFGYSGGMSLTGNTNRDSIVVNWLSTPFAAQYIRIWPKTYNGGICMRADLLGCEDFQVPFVFVDKLQDAVLPASSPGSVTLHCVATFSKQRPPIYQWRIGVTDLPESSSSLTIRFTDINSNYQCSRTSSSVRDFQCYATYQCSASPVDLPQIKDDTNANVTAIIKIPGKPTVNSANIQARSAEVTWTYSRESDEAPIDSFTLRHQNKDILLSSNQSSKQLNNLEPYTSYTVNVKATSFLGTGDWSDPKTFRTLTAAPSVPQNLQSNVVGPSRNTRPEMTVTWGEPAAKNGIITRYALTYSYNYGGKHMSFQHTTNNRTFSYSFYVLGGIRYSITVKAETIKPGLSASGTKEVSVYKPSIAPQNITSQKINEATYNISWDPLSREKSNGPVIAYEVEHTRVSSSSNARSTRSAHAVLQNTTQTYVVLHGLTSSSTYSVKVRAYTLAGAGDFSSPVNISTTAIIPKSTPKEQGGAPTAAIAASVVVVLILALVAAIVGVIFWRRRRRADESSSKSSEMHAMTTVNVNTAYDTLAYDGAASQESPPREEEPGTSGSSEKLQETSEPIYGNTGPGGVDDLPKPVPVSQFSEYVTQLRRDKNSGFAREYKLLAPGQLFPWEVAKKPENKSKNRYGNIIAYDHSRVELPLVKGIENSDYTNANYLHGYDGTPKTYIACQGPVPGTFPDFWRMVWQENVTTVVMLTRLVEHGRTKCHQYWPDNSETYLDITVTNHKTETFADYAIRTFVLVQNGSGERRQLQQFHFLVWPDKGVPRHATAVLGLRRKVRAKHTDDKTPLVVHCSAGIGRTGAFVVIDAMLESVKNNKVVDVFNYVQLIRNNRISMVQTEEQYGFIYTALLEAITCGNTEIPAHDLRIAVKQLAAVNPKTKLSGLASEYQRLNLITADDVADREDEIGRKPDNAAKNRFPDIVPLDGSRVVLKADEKNNYINASFVDTFRERNSFIMTQAPLDNTTEDFWKMVWDYNIGTIVMLNELKEKGQVYPSYWATEGFTTFGEFVIETTSREIFQDFSEREFTVTKKKNPKITRHVHHYQVTGWPDKGIPKNAHCILDLINMVERAQRKTSNAPVVVQCSDGVGRSGAFCAILSIIERLKSEQVIDVLQSVKVIRVNKPRAVNSKAQYVFCYNIVQKYLDSFNDYANFN